MRYATISEEEIHEIKKMCESIMSRSSHGLFHSTGKIIGQSITKSISDKDRLFEEAAIVLKERDMVKEIFFDEKTVTVRGSIEVKSSDSATCSILKGIIIHLYQERLGKKLYCEEVQCESTGEECCKFEIREDII